MRYRAPVLAALGLVGLAAFACTAFSDPAVRLAHCLRRATAAAQAAASCDLRSPGEVLVVLHPQGELSAVDLVAAGVPPETVPIVRQLRLGSNPAIYVIPRSGAQRPSVTTAQMRFVRIPHALAVAVTPGTPVAVELERDGPGFLIRDLGVR